MNDQKPGLPTIDVNEYGGKKEGVRQQMNRRLFMQLVVFDDVDPKDVLAAVKFPAVVYADVNDPRASAILVWGEDPAKFTGDLRSIAVDAGVVRVGWTMLGRTYASGYEPDLEHWLLRRPIENATNEAYPWAVWYPLRRTGAFARLPDEEQSAILREHAQIGLAYGQQNLAHDIRLACHGLDAADNEFVIGLVGAELHPISHLVQAMRKTRQTSQYIEKMGPFFVGHVVGRKKI
jgi:chlorite dismutase